PGGGEAGGARGRSDRRSGGPSRRGAGALDAAHGDGGARAVAQGLARRGQGRHHRRAMTQTDLQDAQTAFSGTREVDPRYALDEARLGDWLTANVDGYAGPLTVRQFKGGQSNPTYELTTPDRAYVLRRKPPGTLLASAHAVDREFRVISALHAQGYPVARPWALCTDEAVIGSMFYVMDKVEGRVLWDLKLPGMTPDQRRDIYHAQADTLAALHAFDPAAIGLGDYGRPGNYFERQVGRWTKQYRAS